MDQVKLHESQTEPQEYVLVKPGYYPARTGPEYQKIYSTSQQIRELLPQILDSEYLALDLETRGSDYSTYIDIVGIGLAWDKGSCYIPFSSLYQAQQSHVLDLIYKHPKLLAHNIYFDGGVLYSKLDRHPNWHVCTYALYKQVANEGWAGQQHGLKKAMVEQLGWTDTNETDLDIWLVLNGYQKGTGSKEQDPELLKQQYLEGRVRPDKGEMWRAPTEILAKYCILDAEACYLLYTRILKPVVDMFPSLSSYHSEKFMYLITKHIEQKIYGIQMDLEGLQKRQEYLNSEIDKLNSQFLCHPLIQPHVLQMEQELLSELVAREPAKYNKYTPPKEPKKYNKDGSLSKSWTNWEIRMSEDTGPVLSKTWINWSIRLEEARKGNDPAYKFNLNSVHHLSELIYRRLGNPVFIRSETGEPSTSGDAMRKLGSPFDLLIRRSHLNKELGYIQAYIDMTQQRNTLHPNFRTPGPVTGRLSSTEPNMQQISKTRAVMSLFQAFPGEIWADVDFKALESVVAAELSGDRNLMQLYAPWAPENDVHCFIAAQTPGLGDRMLATGYDPYNPTPETLAAAKKCKADRSIAKGVVYSAQYGAGTDKMYESLVNDGVEVTWDQVDTVRRTYWSLFSRLKEYSYELRREMEVNGGYIINGLGRPMCIAKGYEKDLLSRQLQSTGHDILVEYVYILGHLLDERIGKDKWRPVIFDFHDATTVGADEKYGPELVKAMEDSMVLLNKTLGGTLALSGVPILGYNLAEVKEPEQ